MFSTALLQEKFSAIKVKSWEYKGLLSGRGNIQKNFCIEDFLKKLQKLRQNHL